MAFNFPLRQRLALFSWQPRISELDHTGHEVGHQLAAAAIGHVDDLNAGCTLEPFHRQMG